MFDGALERRAAALIDAAAARRLKIATAESCTGGLVAGLVTAIAGSSAVFERGFIVYSNAAKSEVLGVPEHLIARFGAVSEECARALCEGAIARSHADIAVSVTGIAGPGGGGAEKPVGLVHFACARRGALTSAEVRRFGDVGRDAVRLASVEVALGLLEKAVLR